MTPPLCDNTTPDDPAIVADEPAGSGVAGFRSVFFLFGFALGTTGAMTRPTGCSPFAPAYCDAPTS